MQEHNLNIKHAQISW